MTIPFDNTSNVWGFFNTSKDYKELRECPFDLYSTGSWYFGDYRVVEPLSDYDFFCQYSEENMSVLHRKGFQSYFIDDRTNDPNIARIFRKDTNAIYLVESLALKQITQHWLKSNPTLYLETPKEKRHLLWRAGNDMFNVLNLHRDITSALVNNRVLEMNGILLPDI